NGTLLARFCPRKEYVFPIASVTVLQPMTPDTPEGIPGQPMQTIPDDRRTLVLTTSSSMSKNLPSASLPHRTPQAPRGGCIVENNGFEPLTPCVQGRCSSQLS